MILSAKILPFAVGSLLFFVQAVLSAADTSVAELIQASKAGAELARIKAIDEIAIHGEQAAEAVTPLTQLLADASARVRAHAAYALGAIGAPSKPAAEALTSLLKDDDAGVRRQAVWALVEIRPKPEVTIPLFVKLMEDSDPGVRLRILQAMSEAGPDAVPGLIEALQNEKAAYWACLVLREMGPDAKQALPALVQKLKDKHPEVRREAALALGAMQEAAIPALPQLAAALEDEPTREAATFALGQIGQIPAGAEAKIQANAASKDKFLSTVSYWTLARAHPDDKELRRKATQRHVERITDRDPLVRVAAARALVALPPAPDVTLPIWEKALQNADESTVQHALDALASQGPAAVPRLIDALKHKKLRAQAAFTLGEMGPPAAAATDSLAQLVGDADARVATEAALALARIGSGAKASAPSLLAALQQPECRNAHAIVYALGRIGPGAVSADSSLIELMESKDHSLAVLSAWALTRLHPPSQENAARTLPMLMSGLAEPRAQSRQTAAEALGSLGPFAKEAIGALTKASTDKEPAVREAAAEALRLIRDPTAK